MTIIGCDYHPGFQQIAFVDTETGELQERRLQHREEAEKFYRHLAAQGIKVRVGMEASGHGQWFERLLAELNFELWIGDAAEIQAKRVRKQKTDRQDAQHILGLLLENRFPQIWVPNWENRDVRQLWWHRHRMFRVRRRCRICSKLHPLANLPSPAAPRRRRRRIQHNSGASRSVPVEPDTGSFATGLGPCLCNAGGDLAKSRAAYEASFELHPCLCASGRLNCDFLNFQ
jgi:Transposase